MDREIMKAYLVEIMSFTSLHADTVLNNQWSMLEFKIATTTHYKLFEMSWHMRKLKESIVNAVRRLFSGKL